MTVLQVCAFGAPSPGNFISALTSLECALSKDGIKTIYAFAETAKERPWCKELCKRTKVYFLPVAHARIRPETYQMMRRIFRENRIDIVHSHFELYDIPATVMAPKKAKIFWHLHDPIGYNKTSRLSRKISRKILERLQYGLFSKRATLLSVSKEHAKCAADMGFNRKRIFYIPNGIDTSRIHPAYGSDKLSNFLMFGWDVIRKGVDLVVAADSGTSLPDCSIRIIGQSACQQYIQDHPTEHITFGKPVDDINALYRHSKAFIHVSRAEGLSYALLEAICAGLPVICSDIPENKIAEEFKGVFWVRDGEIEDIRRQILAVCNMPTPLTEKEFRDNKKLIERRYSLDAWKDQILKMYLQKEQN